jgi:hypothetical protein
MSNAPILLHEYIDIVGEGAMAYMAHTVGFDTDAAADRSLDLVGTWYTMGSTGRWPQVVNIWECVDGFAGWRRLMESTNLKRTKNPALNSWWQEAYKSRTGGFDRLLRGAPGTPTVAELQASGRQGSLFVHELSKCRPGAARDYLAAVEAEWLPILAEYNHTPVGLYEVLMTDTEVITVWCADPAGHEALMRAADTDPRIPAWRARARDFLTEWREELMTPGPGSLMSAGDPL